MGASCASQVPLLLDHCVVDGMKADDLSEVVEPFVAVRCVWKIRQWSIPTVIR